jgi:hypothetical protein
MIKNFDEFILESSSSIREFSISDPDKNYPFKMVSDDLYKTFNYSSGKFEELPIVIGIVPVIFSYRIRAGYDVVDGEYNLDYCAGADQTMVEYLFNIILNALRYKKGDPFKDWPFQEIKPYFKDEKNFPKLLKMLQKDDMVKVDIPDVKEIRKDYFEANKYFMK